MHSQELFKCLSNHVIFRLTHYAFMALQLRDELAKSSAGRSCLEWQPFTLWLTHILLSFAGDIFVNVLLGRLPLEPFSNGQEVLLSTVIWYLVFYSPFDCVYAMIRSTTFRLLATPVAAINQLMHVERGVQLAGKAYGSSATLPILVVGTVVGSGAEFLKPVAALFINRCQLHNAAYVKLSTNSKVALCLAWLQLLHLKRRPNLCQLQSYALLTLICFKWLNLFYRMEHLIWLLEQRLCYALFGGLASDLTKIFRVQPPARRSSFPKF